MVDRRRRRQRGLSREASQEEVLRGDLPGVQRIPAESADGAKLEYELIGCELHDGACQYVASAKMLLESLRNEQNDSSRGDPRRLDMALGLLERADKELRRQLGKDVLSLSVTPGMFRGMEENVEGSFLQRETWKSLME